MVEQIRVYSAPVHLDVLVAIFLKKTSFIWTGESHKNRRPTPLIPIDSPGEGDAAMESLESTQFYAP